MKMYICKLCTAKIDVVLVQILRNNIVQKPITAFARIRFPTGLHPLPGRGFHPQTPSAPLLFFSLRRPWLQNVEHL